FSGATFATSELRRCEMQGIRGVEALRGARIPLADLLPITPLLADALGIVPTEEPGARSVPPRGNALGWLPRKPEGSWQSGRTTSSSSGADPPGVRSPIGSPSVRATECSSRA